MNLKTLFPITVLLFIIAFPAASHHSFPGIYDVKQRYLLNGVVTEYLFRNPHSFIFLNVKGDDGEVTTWHLELPPKWAMQRYGVPADLLVEGDELLVVCNPHRKGIHACGIGQQGGFIRHNDDFLYGKDPRKVDNPDNG